MDKVNQLTNLQLELLKLFNYQTSKEQLSDIKSLLSSYFAKNATDKFDLFWDKKKWNKKVVENIKNEHLRTKYE
jgi:hypothetical protein